MSWSVSRPAPTTTSRSRSRSPSWSPASEPRSAGPVAAPDDADRPPARADRDRPRRADRRPATARDVALTRTEFDLLAELTRHAGQVLSRDVLLDRIWGYDYLGDSRLVDVAIGRLRAKIEADPAAPELILTVRGAGYKAAR